jgi:methanogenic corrinoid protein MtbC1
MNERIPLVLEPSQSDQHELFKEHLALVVEHHVPAQLEQSYREAGRHRLASGSGESRSLTSAEIDELAESFLVSAPGAFIDVLERQGLASLGFAEFYRGVVQPIARALGEMWCDDKAGFLAVSIATERLRLAVDTLYPDFDVVTRHAKLRALITCHDDSQHNFGAFLLSKAFVMADWLVDMRDWNDASGSPMGHVSRNHYDFVGISVGSRDSAKAVAKAVAQIRAKSLNRRVAIGLGGPGPLLNPGAFAEAGADFVSTDAVDAVENAGMAVGALRIDA